MKRRYVYDGPREGMVTDEKAQAFGEALESLAKEKGGKFVPKDVVELARRKASPLHDYFDWEDKTAAAKWRVEQARHLVRVLKVKVDRDGDERLERAFICVDVEAEEHAPKKVFVQVREHSLHAAGAKAVTEFSSEWLQLQVRSFLKQNARTVEYEGTKYVLTEDQAIDLAKLVLSAAGITVSEKRGIQSFADVGPEAN